MRYGKPDTGNAAFRVERYVESTGVVATTCGTGFIAVVVGIPLAINISPFFALFFLPVLVYAILGLAFYLPKTVPLPKSHSEYFQAKYKILPKLRGSMEYDIAMPMVRKIYEHTIEHHSSTNPYWTCSSCGKRLSVLKELVPNKTTDESDMEFAKMWLEEKKKLMIGA